MGASAADFWRTVAVAEGFTSSPASGGIAAAGGGVNRTRVVRCMSRDKPHTVRAAGAVNALLSGLLVFGEVTQTRVAEASFVLLGTSPSSLFSHCACFKKTIMRS